MNIEREAVLVPTSAAATSYFGVKKMFSQCCRGLTVGDRFMDLTQEDDQMELEKESE